jgi:hypothetical protein
MRPHALGRRPGSAGVSRWDPSLPAWGPGGKPRRTGLAWGWHGVGMGLAWAEWGRMGTDLQDPWPVGRQVAEVAGLFYLLLRGEGWMRRVGRWPAGERRAEPPRWPLFNVQ